LGGIEILRCAQNDKGWPGAVALVATDGGQREVILEKERPSATVDFFPGQDGPQWERTLHEVGATYFTA
jgi:hypothetical protein